MQHTLDHCSSLRVWNERIAPASRCRLPLEVIAFPRRGLFADYLLSGTTALPPDPRLVPEDWHAAANSAFDDEAGVERMAGWDDKCKVAFSKQQQQQQQQQDHEKESPHAFTDIVDKVAAAMKRISEAELPSDGVCVSGAFCTADDAGWALESNTPSCTSIADVFTTLTTSTKFTRDVRAQQQLLEREEDDSAFFALRPWLNVNPSTEFRVFVEHGKVVGVCQRCIDQLFPHLFPFAVPLGSSGVHDDRDDDESDNEEDADRVRVTRSVKWAQQIQDLILANVVDPIVRSAAASNDDEERVTAWLLAPSLVIDIVHEGPDRSQFPVYILGVRAVESLRSLSASSASDQQQHEIFRIFQNYDGLCEWRNAVAAHFGDCNSSSSSSKTLVRIATSAEELTKDNRAAQRGGVPLDMMDPALYAGLTEQMQQQQMQQNQNVAHGADVVQRIMAARAHVHGAEDPVANSGDGQS